MSLPIQNEAFLLPPRPRSTPGLRVVPPPAADLDLKLRDANTLPTPQRHRMMAWGASLFTRMSKASYSEKSPEEQATIRLETAGYIMKIVGVLAPDQEEAFNQRYPSIEKEAAEMPAEEQERVIAAQGLHPAMIAMGHLRSQDYHSPEAADTMQATLAVMINRYT